MNNTRRMNPAKKLGLIVFIACCSNVTTAQEILPELVRRVKPSVVVINVLDEQSKPFAMGSGFCIAPGFIVTNYHVIQKSSRFKVKLANGDTHDVQRIAATDELNDLAILETGLPASKLLPLPLSPSLPQEGERVFVISNPRGLQGTISDGIVSSIRRFASGRLLVQMTAAISPGSSGGAVINLRGQVIGVAVGGLENGQSLNFMIPAINIATLSGTLAISATSPSPPSSPNVDPTYSSPELKEVLEWISGKLTSEYKFGLPTGFNDSVTKNFEPVSFDNCRLVWRVTGTTGRKSFPIEYAVNLSDLDPSAIEVKQYNPDMGPWSVVMRTYNSKPVTSTTFFDDQKRPQPPIMYEAISIGINRHNYELAQRMAKAFSRAITLCGGKKELF